MGQRRLRAGHPLQQQFHLATRRLASPQPGGDYPGVVKDQQVIGLQMIEEVAKMVMADRTTTPVERQQPAGAALRQRVLGDKLRG